MIDARAMKALMIRHEKLLSELSEVERAMRELVDGSLLDLAVDRGASPASPVASAPSPVAVAATPVAPPDPSLPPGHIRVPPYRKKIEFLLWKLRVGKGHIDLWMTAKELYGSDSLKNRNRVSRLLSYLASLTLIRPTTGRNNWEILGPVE